VRLIAATAGVLSLAGAAVAYITANIPAVKRTLAWRSDVRVIAFDSSKGVTVLNAGDGPVLLSHVWLRIDGVGTRTLPVNRVVNHEQALRHDWPKDGGEADTWALLERVSPARWAQSVRSAGMTFNDPHHKCYAAAAFSDNDPAYLLYAEARGWKPQYVIAVAKLYYYDLRAGEGSVNLMAKALIFYNETCSRRTTSSVE
jgi:hypothetical protein